MAELKPSILLAEDDEPLATLLTYNLEAAGYIVEVVTRGDEAHACLSQRKPDLLLLDWMLPGLSGIEVCRRVRLQASKDRLPIIMLSARGEQQDRLQALGVGANHYFSKPFVVEELLACIRALARQHLV